jgi:uncharacterized protein YfaS (alpha-2-macroglobulin family)
MVRSRWFLAGSAGFFWRLIFLLSLVACERIETATPSVYLLNHAHWTPILALNFAQEVAPLDSVGKAPASPPRLEPAVEGQWRWEDPSRLVFLPEHKTFLPDSHLSIALEGLPLRDGHTTARQILHYRTPPLAMVRQDCRWRDRKETMQRAFEALVEFNYPVIGPAFNATLGENVPVPLSHGATGSRFSVNSSSMARPAENTRLAFETKPGDIRIADRDRDHGLVAGGSATLEKGAACQLAVARSDWDAMDEEAPHPPTVTGFAVTLENGKLAVRLQGRNLTESARKIAAGQEVKTGVSLGPAVAGVWTYGDAAEGPDLIFTPAKPEALPPGTRFDIAVDAAAFPRLTFEKPRLTQTFKTPDLAGRIEDIRLYTDPVNPAIKRVTATLVYNYPLQRGSLEIGTSVLMREEPAKTFANARPISFELSYDDKNPGTAYLKTAPIGIPNEPGEVRIAVGSGVVSSLGGAPSSSTGERHLAIPGVRDYFKVTGVETDTVVKDDGDIERVLIVRTTVPLKDASALPAAAVEVYLLPDCAEQNPERPAFCADKDVREWQSADQVDADVLKASTRLPVAGRDLPEEDKTLHYLTFSAPEKRQVLVRINQGLESIDGYRLTQDARTLLTLGENQREVKILHDGALLSLTGAKKLGVAVRGLPKVRVKLQQVLPHNMHHLARFTEGDFQKPDFTLPLEHFAETFTYDETLPAGKEMERQYFAVDFARFIKDKGFPPRGLFLLTVSEIKPEKPVCASESESAASDEAGSDTGESGEENPEATETEESGGEDRKDCEDAAAEDENAEDGESEGEDGAEAYAEEDSEDDGIRDRRLVLLTDLGMLVKTGKDGRQDVFVLSFRTGQPVAGAQVWLLGKNGVPVASGKTDASGYAALPSVAGLKDEKTPAVYLVEKDNDMSFLPYSRKNRLLDVSRFDIDGLRDAADSLQAFVFSDRGIYRPGDTVHVGLILRKRDWSPLPPGLPLEAVITDPEDQEIETRTLSFGPEGFEVLDWTSAASGKTGTYRIELFVAKDRKKSLGHATVRVEEFQPDRLQVRTEIPDAPATGWLAPTAAKARVTVRNLFGTPAQGNTAKLEMTVRPWLGQAPGYSDYRFRASNGINLPDLPRDLGEAQTDAQGAALFDLPLASIAEPVFEIALAGEGFEKGAGRSVVNVMSALVSKHSFLLGYAADGGLDYISKGAKRPLKLLALGPDFRPRDVPDITVEIYETRYVSTLVKREDGLYAYQSVQRDEKRKTGKIGLPGGQAAFDLTTENPGTFFAVFRNAEGEELNRVAYSVAGDGNVSRKIERNAELSLTLSKKEYQPGEELEVQIVAPYQGAGLLTIEQDGVIASRWFKTDTTASVQRIPVPQNALGNAYLSVAFVRSLDSPEIYMSPLSYGVASFAISRQRFMNEVSLSVPETVQPGTNLNVRYQVKEATKLVLYAVDEGILQFAHYRNPEPLDHFFRKRALQVRTHQILDLILPDYALVRKLSSPGGDGDAETFGKYKNPFARKHKPPMAFWSGIVEAGPGEHVLSIPVPDYFNGTIRVLAVAANAGKLATPTARVVAKNPFVIQPQQPYAVAPGDEFDMGVLVANTTGESGATTVDVSVAAGDALELLSPNPQKLTLEPGQDGTVRFHARAREKLGPVAVRYRAVGGGRETTYGEEISLRPAQPLMTTLQNGVLRIEAQRSGKSEALELKRNVYPEQRHAEIAVSMTPMAYLRGIVEYLKNYPYGCIEQIVSQSFPAVVLGANPELGLSPADVERYFGKAVHTLQTRQKHDGSFGYWSAADPADPFYSMYATHLLLEARERGLKVPDALLERALGYADRLTQETHYDWRAHRAEAYALYLLARNRQNVAERLKAFEAEIERQWGQGGPSANWVRFFLGAAYKLHHLDGDADRFFGEFQRQWKKTGLLPWDIQQDPDAMSQYLYLANQHFPELIDAKDPQFGRYLLELAQDLAKRRVNSFSGSLTALGLGGLWTRFDRDEGKAFSVLAGQPPAPLELLGKSVKRALLEPTARRVEMRGDGTWNLYYQLTERGYDRALPDQAISQQLAITRELLNGKGEKAGELDLQDKLHIRFALHPDRAMEDVAVVMLIPGGFEIDLGEEGLGARQSLPVKDKPLWEPEYIDVQEDRVVLFGDLDGGEKYFEFRLKPLNSGVYTVPPVFAEGMYDTEVLFRGVAESVRVKE